MRSRDTFDAVLASSPNGATAAIVTGKGQHYEPDVDPNALLWHWDAPPRHLLKPVPRHERDQFVDLTGTKFGRMTVIGYLGRMKAGVGALWLCRCACGDYEGRKARSIKRADAEASCAKCHDFQHKRWLYAREGSRPISDFFEPRMQKTEQRP